MTEIEICFENSPFYSRKHRGYFQSYQSLLEGYKNKSDLVLVEVGVLEGGSLFMWRSFFPMARIIGIDLNPAAKKWEDYGFEIHIGSQSDEEFWSNFFQSVGYVDILIDDGGHTSLQQAVTFTQCISKIRENGVLIVEDTHTSYQGEFGNPSKSSFVNSVLKSLHSMNPMKSEDNFSRNVSSVSFHPSMIAFHASRKGKAASYEVVENFGRRDFAGDFRYRDSIAGRFGSRLLSILASRGGRLATASSILLTKLIGRWGQVIFRLSMKLENVRSARVMRRWNQSFLER